MQSAVLIDILNFIAKVKINLKQYKKLVIDKKQLEFGDYDFQIEQLKKEEQITRLCNSENTINFYRKIENGNFIIFEWNFLNLI